MYYVGGKDLYEATQALAYGITKVTFCGRGAAYSTASIIAHCVTCRVGELITSCS
jgi:hypothetical protein